MGEHTHERIVEAVRTGAAEFLARESNYQSLVTVTRVKMDSDKDMATIYLSVLPIEKAKAALDFAQRQRRELREYLKSRTIMGRLPRVQFALETEGDANKKMSS